VTSCTTAPASERAFDTSTPVYLFDSSSPDKRRRGRWVEKNYVAR